MRVNPKYLMLVSDALIPLLGFFVWDWGLYFILLFYILDLLAREVITHVKIKKIYEDQGLKSKTKWVKNGVFGAILLLVVIVLIHLAMYFIKPGIGFIEEIKLFWHYKEMGIEQGYILLPLVGYAAYAQYRMQFLLTGKSKHVLVDTVWKQHLLALVLMGAGAIASMLISFIVPLPEIVFVLAVVTGAGCYSYFLEKV